MESYDYARREGVHSLSWTDFADLSARLAEALEPFGIDVVIGVARAGLFPATAVALNLRRELFPVRVSRRVNDEVIFKSPVWRVPVPPDVAGKCVAVVDEIADTGETLAMVAREVRDRGATRVVTGCLISHSWANPAPDLAVLVTDELVIFPWDRRVLVAGRWEPHPEIVAALKAQGVSELVDDR